MTRHPLTTLVALAVLVAGSTASRADVILDDFSNPHPAAQFLIGSQNANPYTLTTDLGGGTIRTATFGVTSPNPPGPFSLLGVVGGGSLDLFLDSTSSGYAVIKYALGTPLDLRGIGGSSGAIRLTSQSAATVGNPDVPFTLSLFTPTGTLTETGSFVNSAGFVDQDIAFSGFSGSGDISHVTGVSLGVTGHTADDFRLDKIALTQPQQVPAPPAAFLLLAALPALCLRSYFGRKA